MATVHDVGNNDYIGLLDRDTATALDQIHSKYDIETRTYIVRSTGSDNKTMGQSWGASLPIYIVVYGCEEQFDVIGDTFADFNIFLQHPQDRKDLVVYKNPQYLVRPGEEYPCLDGEDADPSNLPDAITSDSGSPIENQLESVFETAQGPEKYSGVEQSSRLTTALKP